MKYVMFIFGMITVLIGLTIYGWVIFNLVNPTPEFKTGTSGLLGKYLLPAVMIIVGVKWMLAIRKKGIPERPLQ
jgi:hypothetical protein